ncbi:uncharacterized protein EI90DRAFT_2068524 [Cantharellus anzutake]|uniref:uncharacterized protein n=1 Tax=Cantharellus anzutake TaxID=1750568 RepID=UPI0019069404|nr:uncharacterized protein EI90DRAFT_2068524 [Cantharellus anzutake]KAF8340477.1 hypothetical protein EI90DRAFT_2068524 [Cantharellus anzutake]
MPLIASRKACWTRVFFLYTVVRACEVCFPYWRRYFGFEDVISLPSWTSTSFAVLRLKSFPNFSFTTSVMRFFLS